MSGGAAQWSESQRFFGRTPALILLVACALVAGGVSLLELGGPGPIERGRWVPLVVLSLLGLGMSWLFARLELSVDVLHDHVKVHFAPLTRRLIRHDDIVSCEPCRYRPLRDYGGWGVRRSRHGAAYTVRGERGVRLELAGGEGLLIGSQRPESLCRAIEEARGRRGRSPR